VIVGAVIGSIILGIIYLLFESLRERLKNYAINKKKAFVFNGYLRGIYVSFIEMCLTVGFQVKMLINDSSYVVELQANTSYVIAGYVSVIPFVIMYWMLRNREVLDTKEFRSKFGNMYADVHLKRSPWTIVYQPLFLLRRIMFVAIPCTLVGHPSIQIQLYSLFTSLYIIFVINIDPHVERIKRQVEIFNEFVILIVGYHLFTFTNFVRDEMK
jgi:hypothetical protein